jgi:phage terminase large subunit GpA-like protein
MGMEHRPMMPRTSQNVHEELVWLTRQSRAHKRRTMREFAEQEVIIPDGPYAGRRFRCSRQPYSGLWFDAIDSGLWSRYVGTGPTQSGKTLSCFVIPLLYHLFEIGETVICGLPDMDMAGDKWREDILPVIEQSQFRHQMPTTGSGSRGGRVEAIRFLNGATLKFMSGGGGDKSRAGFTSRVIVITETDGMDQQGTSSRESDKITQLEARTRAYGARRRIYMECTVSTEQGRTWQEYQNGTRSRIVLSCPHCQAPVAPEREHLQHWQETTSQVQARTLARFVCPACQQDWSDADRQQANATASLLHHGQDLAADGSVSGTAPETDTLGFRWSAVNNLFLTAGDIAADEWRASRAADEENAEREMRQFVWCVPVASSKSDETSLPLHDLTHRISAYPKGIVPPDAKLLTCGIDLGKYLAHWVVVAWSDGATGYIVDYGRLEIASPDLGVEKAILLALREFHEQMKEGYPVRGSDERRPLQLMWIDAGYMTDVVYNFVREHPPNRRILPAIGRGAAQQRTQWYNRPTSTGSVVRHIGEGFHINLLAGSATYLVEVDADHWKSWVHQRLATPMDQPGAMTLFAAPPAEHLSFAKHLTAETKTEEYVAGRGVVTKWERVRKNNHWFDALYNACALGHYAGIRLLQQVRPPRKDPPGEPRERRDPRELRRVPWVNLDGWHFRGRRRD